MIVSNNRRKIKQSYILIHLVFHASTVPINEHWLCRNSKEDLVGVLLDHTLETLVLNRKSANHVIDFERELLNV